MSVSDLIVQAAQAQGVDPSLALEVANRESGLNQAAIGSSGEIGVFQLMPATAASLGVDPGDLQQNIQGGIALLRQLLGKYGDPGEALAAYNMGETKFDPILRSYGANWFSYIPSSTQSYVNAILGNVASKYQPAFNPAPFVTGGSTLILPPSSLQPLASSNQSIWTTVLVAVAVIFGLGFVLSES